MKQIKKFAAALLAIVMFATICPFGALADTDRQRDETNAIPEAVADVIAAINALSPVENLAYDLDDLELATSAVNNAEALYDELSDEEKAMVSNYVILLEAKDVIAARQFEKLVYDRLCTFATHIFLPFGIGDITKELIRIKLFTYDIQKIMCKII